MSSSYNATELSPVHQTIRVLLTLIQERVGGAYQASCGQGYCVLYKNRGVDKTGGPFSQHTSLEPGFRVLRGNADWSPPKPAAMDVAQRKVSTNASIVLTQYQLCPIVKLQTKNVLSSYFQEKQLHFKSASCFFEVCMDYDVIDDGGNYKSRSIEVFLQRMVRVP